MSTTVAHGLHLIQSGALLITTGLLWGPFIPKTPFPRAALSAHINFLQHGLLSIAAGLVLNRLTLSEWQVLVVAIPHYYLWITDVVLIANSWWGTNKGLAIV
jgi:(hydroxyamino)benzene mutase